MAQSDTVLSKIINKQFDKLTVDDHLDLGKVTIELNLSKQLWTYAKHRSMSFYWPKEKTSILLEWNKRMIAYYYQFPQSSFNSQYPTIIRFTYRIDYGKNGIVTERQTALGKYIDYRNKITPEEWKKKLKDRLKKMIRKDTVDPENNDKIISIKIYNINEKDNGYESDDVYAFKCEEKSLDDDIVETFPMPPIPSELYFSK